MAHPHRKRVEHLGVKPLGKPQKMRAHLPEICPRRLRLHGGWHAHESPETQERVTGDGFRERIQVLTGYAAFLVLRTDVDLDQNILNNCERPPLFVELTREALPIHGFHKVGKTADIFYLIRLQMSNKMHIAAVLFKESFLFSQFLGVIFPQRW